MSVLLLGRAWPAPSIRLLERVMHFGHPVPGWRTNRRQLLECASALALWEVTEPDAFRERVPRPLSFVRSLCARQSARALGALQNLPVRRGPSIGKVHDTL